MCHYNKRLLWFGGVLFISIINNLVQAEERMQLDEVTVSAPLPTSPTVNIYTKEGSVSRPHTDGADYLQSIPGITAGRSGGHGLEPNIRGQSQNQLNIIADNAFLFGACPNRLDPSSSYLNIDSYDEIVVTKGYQSVLNGPGATGGSIILKRKSPIPATQEKLYTTGSASGGYDSNGKTWFSNLNFSGGNQKVYARARTSFKEANNYKDGNNNEVRSAFQEKTGGITLGLTPYKDGHLYVSYDLHQIEDSLFPGAGMDSPLSRGHTTRIGFEKKYLTHHIRNVDITAYGSLIDHVMDNYSLRQAGRLYRRVYSDSNTYGAKIKADIALKKQTLTTAIEFRHNNRDANRLQGTTTNNVTRLQSVMWPDITMNEIGLALETTYQVSPTRRMILGGRYDYVNVGYGRASQRAINRSANDLYVMFYGYDANRQTEHNIGGLLRYEHDITKDITLFAGISRATRTADATERGLANDMIMQGMNRSWVGNPLIKPEKHHQLDLGMQIDRQKWDIGVSTYVNRIDNFILRDAARGQTGILINAPHADIYRNIGALFTGFEIQGGWNALPVIRLEGDIAYTYGNNLSDNLALPQVPPLHGSLALLWQAHTYAEVMIDMQWALRQNRTDTNPTRGTGRDIGESSGYAIWGINTTITKLEPFFLTIGIDNLLDKKYTQHLNRSNISDPTEVRVNEPGRSFYLQIKMVF